MSPSTSCFSFETSFTTSPLSTVPLTAVELLHLGSSRVADTTYLGMLFSRSAHSPLRDSHRAANHSSVRRPSSRASAPSASASSSLAHSSRALSPISKNQPPCLKPSSPVGSWTTPSSETFSLMMIFPMSGSPLPGVVCYHRCRHHDAAKLGAGQPPSSLRGRCLCRTAVRHRREKLRPTGTMKARSSRSPGSPGLNGPGGQDGLGSERGLA